MLTGLALVAVFGILISSINDPSHWVMRILVAGYLGAVATTIYGFFLIIWS